MTENITEIRKGTDCQIIWSIQERNMEKDRQIGTNDTVVTTVMVKDCSPASETNKNVVVLVEVCVC